jgi:hypothetical protein
MIEGLKVTIVGNELRELCAKRADHHRDRSKVYGEQIAMMEKNEVEGMNYTGGDPKRALADKQTEHESQAGEMDFIAAHLVADEQYLLDSQALVRLGIAKSRY